MKVGGAQISASQRTDTMRIYQATATVPSYQLYRTTGTFRVLPRRQRKSRTASKNWKGKNTCALLTNILRGTSKNIDFARKINCSFSKNNERKKILCTNVVNIWTLLSIVIEVPPSVIFNFGIRNPIHSSISKRPLQEFEKKFIFPLKVRKK